MPVAGGRGEAPEGAHRGGGAQAARGGTEPGGPEGPGCQRRKAAIPTLRQLAGLHWEPWELAKRPGAGDAKDAWYPGALVGLVV